MGPRRVLDPSDRTPEEGRRTGAQKEGQERWRRRMIGLASIDGGFDLSCAVAHEDQPLHKAFRKRWRLYLDMHSMVIADTQNV